MTAVCQFDKVFAEFRPKRLDTLKPEAREVIGLKCLWEALWIIEEGESEPYTGQWAMRPLVKPPPDFAWAPEEDLRILAAEP